MPFDKPEMVQLVAVVDALQDPLDEPPISALKAVTVLVVIAEPLFAGAAQLTTTEPFPAVYEIESGFTLLGTVNGVPETGDEAVLLPITLRALSLTE